MGSLSRVSGRWGEKAHRSDRGLRGRGEEPKCSQETGARPKRRGRKEKWVLHEAGSLKGKLLKTWSGENILKTPPIHTEKHKKTLPSPLGNGGWGKWPARNKNCKSPSNAVWRLTMFPPILQEYNIKSNLEQVKILRTQQMNWGETGKMCWRQILYQKLQPHTRLRISFSINGFKRTIKQKGAEDKYFQNI